MMPTMSEASTPSRRVITKVGIMGVRVPLLRAPENLAGR